MPRLPLNGSIDLTYRCNNNCRHCWLWLSEKSIERKNELTLDEILKIVNEARKMGCRGWKISGGEPMLRPDFPEIFDYILSKSISYSLNTNGTFITPQIARLMKKKGNKMVALYGATAEVHDHITRKPGSFEAAMRGFAYLKEADVGFTVQIIPMRDNYPQYKEMVKLAESLSPIFRIGAPWLWLSSCENSEKNQEILRQRLDPEDAVKMDEPDICDEKFSSKKKDEICSPCDEDDRIFKSCIENRLNFHIDPYGKMTFCGFIKESSLRFDLRGGSFSDCWEKFIPSLVNNVRGGKEYIENCGSCELRSDCRWCPVYAYLEHGRFSAKQDYLCSIAKATKAFKSKWRKNHRRYYEIAGITVRVESDLPFTDKTFDRKFKYFEIKEPGKDIISIQHHFSLLNLDFTNLGKKVYERPPWFIYRKGTSWIYLCTPDPSNNKNLNQAAVFNHDHSKVQIYSLNSKTYKKGGLTSLTMFSTDQIQLGHVFAYRNSCHLHSSGIIYGLKGLLFAGPSGAGKSTIVKMFKNKAEVLCDDRIIIRKWNDGFKIHGTWSHGEVPIVSGRSAPLDSILFLQKAHRNRLIPLTSQREIIKRLLSCVVKPFVTVEWWEKTLSVVEHIAQEIPCYVFQFDKSDGAVKLIEERLGKRL